MIAEIKGKISSTGSNLSERLEDKLTGDFFGSLRYIPFNKGAGSILSKTKVLNEDSLHILETIKRLDIDYWANNIHFWPYDPLGEIDLLLEFEEIIIGIEVKLHSGLSSDDGVDNSSYDYKIQSNHQLSRESRILKRKILGTNKQAFLIFIASEHTCYPICKEAYDRNIIEKGIVLGYLSWEEVLSTLEKLIDIEKLNKYEELVVKDSIALLERKGLERFRAFNFECPNIDLNLHFVFDCKNDINIDFMFNQEIIMERGYYEFK
ncbi:hypothetical protein RBH29_07250 [Herbivorax sp. ANBcel31]|uniref:hypothetical protein n=1 Tax=Herbivorax sp. ANBcel31 TaxID=3069754 RepID=UPI0027B689BF|nr:hypothetical protein [Herbivorax sp. ANBcel31]MDQ2086224.1 hypothetical protein [Herbivorax sp. ANBcel31]